MKYLNHSLLTLAVLLICACSNKSFFKQELPKPATLSSLPGVELPAENPIAIPGINLNQLEHNYQKALASNNDPHIQQLIRLRLADIEMTRSEDRQMTATDNGRHYQGAIDQYQVLLKEKGVNGSAEQTDYLRYQLAKAYALDGRTNESDQALNQLSTLNPDSPFMIEALFRRAERSFSANNFRSAAADYKAITAQGENPFFQTALYMQGWSEFKLANYDAATESFTHVLENLIRTNSFASLQKSDKTLADDTLRVLALAFSYMGGGEAIEAFFEQQYISEDNQTELQYRYYLALGNLYLDKERFRDSADTFNAFVRNQPNSNAAPEFSVKAIEAYQRGNFPSEILPAKKIYVKNYGINSDYWLAHDSAQHLTYSKTLHEYLSELATIEHATAQSAALFAAKQTNNSKKKLQAQQESLNAYLAAAAYYAEFSETFISDPKTPEKVFLMAECFAAAEYYLQAFDAYERVAYDYLDEQYGAEAGYAAILSADEIIVGLGARGNTENIESELSWQLNQIESSMRFADYYPTDSRALPVLLGAAENLYRQGDYLRAIAAANRVNEWQPQASSQQMLSANLVIGHSQFDLADFVLAEAAYATALNYSKKSAPLYIDTQQRLAASIYQQAELAYASGDTPQAIENLLRLKDTGARDIASTGHYDAINYLIELERYPQAHTELIDFRRRYPQHPLTGTLTAKAVVILLATNQPRLAADELSVLATTDTDPAVRQQSLFLAAENYQRAGTTDLAINHYRDYAHTYSSPHAQKVEAEYQLSVIYREGLDLDKRNFWLNRLAKYQYKEPRGLYLAAFARTELAEQQYEKFSEIKLSLPLKKSLKKKKNALSKTIKAYEKTLELEVAEFTTQANYRLGAIYQQLSRDLILAEKPRNLNELELEQYNILLEEQAYPFEEKAIDIHSNNIARIQQGFYDNWVKDSFNALAELLPARYNKPERRLEYSDAIY